MKAKFLLGRVKRALFSLHGIIRSVKHVTVEHRSLGFDTLRYSTGVR